MEHIIKIESISGKGIPIRGNEIDTDRIIPARFMKCVTFSGLGKYAFYDERFDDKGSTKNHNFDSPQYRGHSVLIVNKNFGCGSSREHAPQALKDFGISAIIGESFAEIFAGNCTALGIPAVRLSEDDLLKLQTLTEENSTLDITINLQAKKITAGAHTFNMDMPATYRNALMDGTWDSTSLLLSGLKEIENVYSDLPYLHF